MFHLIGPECGDLRSLLIPRMHISRQISPPGQFRRCCTACNVETRYISRQISDRLKVWRNCILWGNNKLLSHNLMQANSVVSQCALLRLQTAVQHAHRRFVAEWNFAVGQYPVFFHTQKILKMLFMNCLWTYFFNLFIRPVHLHLRIVLNVKWERRWW